MTSNLAGLLKLPVGERVRLAMVLWASLGDQEREAQLPLTAKQRAELDRRLAEHAKDPTSAVPWTEVKRKLRARG